MSTQLVVEVVVPAHGSWIEKILECAAGGRTPEELVAPADEKDPEQVCESFYYAAESCLRRGKTAEARRWFEPAGSSRSVASVALTPDATTTEGGGQPPDPDAVPSG